MNDASKHASKINKEDPESTRTDGAILNPEKDSPCRINPAQSASLPTTGGEAPPLRRAQAANGLAVTGFQIL